MCKPGLGHSINFLNWMDQGWFPYTSCNQLHVAGRPVVIYSNCLSSVCAMLTCIIHQLSQQCPDLITSLRLFGSWVRKHTPSASVPRMKAWPPAPAAPTSITARRKEPQACWLTSKWKVRNMSPEKVHHTGGQDSSDLPRQGFQPQHCGHFGRDSSSW